MLSATPMAVVADAQAVEPVDCPENVEAPAAVSQDSGAQEVTSIVFVDSSVEDYQQLVDDIDQSGTTQVVLIDSQSDGVDQISDYLSRHTGIESVHIVSHGTDGEVRLGNTLLNANTLDAYAGQIAGWSNSLTSSADILFYGCDLAATEHGQLVIEALSELTGADINASDDLTGHADLGGDWDLEYVVGHIETDVVFSVSVQQDWLGTLDAVTVSTGTDLVDGDTSSLANLELDKGDDGEISLREAIIAANADAAADTIFLESRTHSFPFNGDGNNLGDLDILTDITIQGAGAGETIISGVMSDRLFQVADGGDLTLQGLTLQGGRSVTGGAVRVDADGLLQATDTVFRDNSATTSGGAIYSEGGVTLNRVSLVDNSADSRGGAITVFGGTTNLTNVTVSGNSVGNSGGGIIVTGGSLTVNHSTIAYNDANAVSGGGIRITGGSATISNSVFADNTDGSAGSNADVSGAVTSGGNNIIEGTEGVDGLIATDIQGVDPGLEVLSLDANSGQFVHVLSTSSIALDAAAGSATILDQRGLARDNSTDIGAFELGATPPPPIEVSFLLSTQDDVAAGNGGPGLDSFSEQEIVNVGGQNFELEPTAGTTDGTFESIVNFDNFADPIGDIDALHRVNITQTVDGVDLEQGDILFSTLSSATYSK